MSSDGEHTYRKPTVHLVQDQLQQYVDVWNTPQGRMINVISGVCGRKKAELFDLDTLLQQLDLGDPTHFNEEAHELALNNMTEFCNVSRFDHTDFEQCVFEPKRRYKSFRNVKTKRDFVQYIMSNDSQKSNIPVVVANLGIHAVGLRSLQSVLVEKKVEYMREGLRNTLDAQDIQGAVLTPDNRRRGQLARAGQPPSAPTVIAQPRTRASDPLMTPIIASPSATPRRGGASKYEDRIPGESKRRSFTVGGDESDEEDNEEDDTRGGESKRGSTNPSRPGPRGPRGPRGPIDVDLRDVVLFRTDPQTGEPVPLDAAGFDALKMKYYQLLCKSHVNNTVEALLVGDHTQLPYSEIVIAAIDEAWSNITANFPEIRMSFNKFAFARNNRIKRTRGFRANNQIRRRLFRYIGTLIPPYNRYMAKHELERIDTVQRQAYENLHEALEIMVK